MVPLMIHRAICGSLERFLGILIENYAGHLPLWLSPVQVVVATITSDGDAFAEEAAAALRGAGLRVATDLRNEKITYKVREHSLAKVPVLAVIGRREAEGRTLSLRRLGTAEQESAPLDEVVRHLADEAVAPDVRRAEGTAAGA
jgi:threonyl-tRNA synthetase